MLLDCLKPNIPPRNRSTPQYYTCFGRLHVKVALQFIIIITFAWDILRWFDFIISRQISAGWVEIFTEICDALFGISLIIAYWYESAPFLLPYLFVQLFTLIISMILFCLCVVTVIWPGNPWASSFYQHMPTKASMIRLNALIYSVVPFIITLMLIWVVHVLLACYVYFNDRKKSLADAPAVVVQTTRSNTDVTITPADGQQNGIATTAVTNAPSNNHSTSLTYSNPNFSLDDDDGEDQLWPQKKSENTPN